MFESILPTCFLSAKYLRSLSRKCWEYRLKEGKNSNSGLGFLPVRGSKSFLIPSMVRSLNGSAECLVHS